MGFCGFLTPSLPFFFFPGEAGKGAFSPGWEKGGRRGEERGKDGISSVFRMRLYYRKG